MKKEYKFPFYTTLKKPDVPFRYVYMNGPTSERMDPQTFSSRWVDVVGWIPVVAEITIKPEDGKWYLCELPGGTQAVLYRSEGAWRTKSVHPFITYADKTLKVIAEMKEVEL